MAQREQSIGQRVLVEEMTLMDLIKHSTLVGGVYTMGYKECSILTNDLWKEKAGGIPQHCFLLAATFSPDVAPQAGDEEIILLRVVSGEPLPIESELVRIREEAMREILLNEGHEAASSPSRILDVLTRNEIQFSGVKAKILGTFCETHVDKKSILAFGSDVENFHSASRYKVYNPYGESLSMIASHPEITEEEELLRVSKEIAPRRIRIGEVRYSSSKRRWEKREKAEIAPVRVNIEDFISLKTAIFGMTRLGKSNTMKILATAIFEHATETRKTIGQLLFDPSGEYANVNVQDQTALAELGPEHVTIFRFGGNVEQPGVRRLTTNFFDQCQTQVAWSIIRAHLRSRRSDTIYIDSFCEADVIGPESEEANRGEYYRAQRRRAALYAALCRAGFRPPQGFSITIRANEDVVNAVNEQLPEGRTIESGSQGRIRLDINQIQTWFDGLVQAMAAGTIPDDWSDAGLNAVLDVFARRSGAGYRLLEPLRVYHSPDVQSGEDTDYASQVLSELAQGKIVIIDLSEGAESVLQFSSERIINHILEDASRRFRQGLEPHRIQIYIEEAHNLFNRERMQKLGEADPYVRLAKEAAKYKIGLIYATQEVTSVDSSILSNTSNWVVTHLNNRKEVAELSKYYDFEDFAESIIRAEDVGFARLKTKSSRYIVPLQIDLFTPERVKQAGQAAENALRTEHSAEKGTQSNGR